jgi:hypothetical protein
VRRLNGRARQPRSQPRRERAAAPGKRRHVGSPPAGPRPAEAGVHQPLASGGSGTATGRVPATAATHWPGRQARLPPPVLRPATRTSAESRRAPGRAAGAAGHPGRGPRAPSHPAPPPPPPGPGSLHVHIVSPSRGHHHRDGLGLPGAALARDGRARARRNGTSRGAADNLVAAIGGSARPRCRGAQSSSHGCLPGLAATPRSAPLPGNARVPRVPRAPRPGSMAATPAARGEAPA